MLRIPIFMDQSPCLDLKFQLLMVKYIKSLFLVVESPCWLCQITILVLQKAGHLELCTAGVLRHDLRDGVKLSPKSHRF